MDKPRIGSRRIVAGFIGAPGIEKTKTNGASISAAKAAACAQHDSGSLSGPEKTHVNGCAANVGPGQTGAPRRTLQRQSGSDTAPPKC